LLNGHGYVSVGQIHITSIFSVNVHFNKWTRIIQIPIQLEKLADDVVKNSWLMEPGGSMTHSQQFSNNPYPETNESNFSCLYLLF